MANELLGADTLIPVTNDLVSQVRKRFGGQTPVFWGRYFKRPGFAQDYQPEKENAVFNQHHIRLLPIARQTNRVAGTASDGAADALLNVQAFTERLGVEHVASVGGELLMFLDVEGTSASHPNLSVDYWIGWSGALVEQSRRMLGGRTTIIPAVYCRQNQNTTWEAIATADNLGFPCAGAWIFRARNNACTNDIPSWDAPFNTPKVELPCPIMAWQFAIDCLIPDGIDFNMINPDPAITTALLNRLLLPPR
jgi:hypothetical protein